MNTAVRMFLVLAAVFVITFIATYLSIFFTQSGHSMPSSYLLQINNMDIALGPPPNSTNIPLDTAVTVEAVASAALNDLHLTPEVPIGRVYSEATSPLTYLNLFYPATLLMPGTTYIVSVTIMDEPVSWVFTTTDLPFEPGTNYFLATNVLWISGTSAISLTAIIGYVVWFKFRRILNYF